MKAVHPTELGLGVGQMDLSQSVGACPVCRSTRYHKTDDGFLLCEFGHQSQGFWEEHDDKETYFGTTRKLASRGGQSRLSQSLDEDQNKLCTNISFMCILCL